MKNFNEQEALREKLRVGFKKTVEKLVQEEKKKNGYLVLFRNGKVVKVPAKDL